MSLKSQTQAKTQTQTQAQTTSSSSYEIVPFLEVEPERITFLPPKANNYGGRFVPMKYNGKSLYVTYDAKSTPFGVSENKEKTTEKVTGYSTGISCDKDFANDPYYQKSNELNEWFIKKCTENAVLWGIAPSSDHFEKMKMSEESIRAYVGGVDSKGTGGKWKSLLKWSYKKDKDTNAITYLDYPPRLEFGIPTVSMTDVKNSETGQMEHKAIFKTVFFDRDACKIENVSNDNIDDVMPKWSRISLLAQWSNISLGTYGVTFKPKAQQIRVYPSEQLSNDECLLNGGDDEDDMIQLGDVLNQKSSKPMAFFDDEVSDVVEVVDNVRRIKKEADVEDVEDVEEVEEVKPPPKKAPVRQVQAPRRVAAK